MLNGINNLADQLFAEKPARHQVLAFDRTANAHRYLQSHVFSGSRGLHPDNHKVPQRVGDTALADEILHTDRLGPYERQLLASLLRAPQSLVLVTGSTGSGKTSTLRSILAFYDENVRLNDATIELGLNPKHAYVDFNKLYYEYKCAEESSKGSGVDALLQKIPTRIADALLASVRDATRRTKLQAKQVVLELARDAYNWAHHLADVPGNCRFEWEDLIEIGPPELTGMPDTDFFELQERLRELAARQGRSNLPLLFWCAVLDVLAIKTLPTGKKTLLLLDNIDALPEKVQFSLRDQFVRACMGANFKVILPLRHSTARVKRPVYIGEVNWYPHCGPNPVEVVCSRLLGFIADPKSYPAFTDLDEKWQRRALQRALELLLRLTRGAPHYRSLGQFALAGAGDSVRRALDTVKYMFERMDWSSGYDKVTIEALSQLAIELRAMSCTSSMGLALREEIVGIAMECDGEPVTAEVIDTWGELLVSTATGVLHRSFDRMNDWRDRRVDRVWEHAEVQSMLREDVETAAALLQERIISLGVAGDAAAQIRAALADAVSVGLRGLCANVGQQPGFVAFTSSVCRALRGEHFEGEHGTDDSAEFHFDWDRLAICATTLSRNRPHIIARALIRDGHVHNLFVDREGRLSLLPLTLIYYLALQDDGEAKLSSVLKLLRLAAADDEVLNLVNRLCNNTARIVWINDDFVHDSCEELDDLAEDGARMKLTHGGYAYYLGVLDEIDYVLETLRDPSPGASDDLLSRRIESAQRQLDHMLHLSSTGRDQNDSMWLSIEKCVVADIIVRCTPGLIRAARGHFSKMQMLENMAPSVRVEESQSTRKAMINWLELLESCNQRLASIAPAEARLSPEKKNAHLLPLGRVGGYRGLGPVCGPWQKRWTNARGATERLLRGGDLWAPSLDSDDYHTVPEETHSIAAVDSSNQVELGLKNTFAPSTTAG